MQNQGATLVADLRLGDNVWSHGENLGEVISIEVGADSVITLLTRTHLLGGRIAARRYFQPGDLVHVGQSLVTATR